MLARVVNASADSLARSQTITNDDCTREMKSRQTLTIRDDLNRLQGVRLIRPLDPEITSLLDQPIQHRRGVQLIKWYSNYKYVHLVHGNIVTCKTQFN